MRKYVLFDTNVLVLFIVGGTCADYIRIHKNCSRFSRADYDALLLHISVAAGVITTAQILSETANLLRQVRDPIRSEIAAFFKLFVLHVRELQPTGWDAVHDDTYAWLGFNDASILACLAPDRVLITEDGNLHAAARTRSTDVLHFTELRMCE